MAYRAFVAVLGAAFLFTNASVKVLDKNSKKLQRGDIPLLSHVLLLYRVGVMNITSSHLIGKVSGECYQ
jgi:hypothetical protein